MYLLVKMKHISISILGFSYVWLEKAFSDASLLSEQGDVVVYVVVILFLTKAALVLQSNRGYVNPRALLKSSYSLFISAGLAAYLSLKREATGLCRVGNKLLGSSESGPLNWSAPLT